MVMAARIPITTMTTRSSTIVKAGETEECDGLFLLTRSELIIKHHSPQSI
jgi:hypothetical protein